MSDKNGKFRTTDPEYDLALAQREAERAKMAKKHVAINAQDAYIRYMLGEEKHLLEPFRARYRN